MDEDDDTITEGEGDCEDESLLGRLRDMPVGLEDPNIVGDVGPTDIPPGQDPDPPEALSPE